MKARADTTTPLAEAQHTEDRALWAIVEGVEAETGDRFFHSLVRQLAVALDVEYAFVSELSADRTRFRTLAVWGRGETLDNLDIPVAGTPCEAVLSGQFAHHPERLQQIFPLDLGLAKWKAESYCGVPLLDGSGTVVGHLAIFSTRPMLDGPRGLSILRIFAARARAEIERVRIETELRDGEARFRDLYEEAPIAYITAGPDGRARVANGKACELLGYGRDELIGKHLFDVVTPDTQPRAREVHERFWAGEGEVQGEELEFRRADGETLWVEMTTRSIRDATGRIVAARVALVDVTARKRAEQARRVSEERLAGVVRSAMDAILTIDRQDRVEIFNAAAEKIFRTRSGEVIGQSLDRFLTEGLRKALESSRAAAERGQLIWVPSGLTARRADGEEFPVEATISHVDVGGRRLSTLIVRDLEERRRAEEELRRLHRQQEYLEEEIRAVHNEGEIVGASSVLREALEKAKLVAATDSTALILGETGTGKELIARVIHGQSARRARPLIKVNCAALPSGLIESELFGHERGAFTGAIEKRVGRFELADGGTLFLDEVAEMPPETQAKLLRVLQEQEFERIGSSRTLRVDVRVIAATNRDLERAVADGKLRQDLYYRLNVFPIQIPPLRERAEDIPLLVHYFVARYAAKIGRRIERVPREVMERFLGYPWPGNVRELENVIERATILSRGPDLEVPSGFLPAARPAAPAVVASPVASPSSSRSLEDVEREHIIEVLRRTRWRIDGPQGAARALEINPSTLRSRMKKLGIRRDGDAS